MTEPDDAAAKTEPDDAAAKTEPDHATAKTEPDDATAKTEPDLPDGADRDLTGVDRDVVTYLATSRATVAEQAALAGIMPYAWWWVVAATFEILFGGMFLGSPQATQIGVHVSPPWLTLFYIAVGSYVGILAFGVLRLERWAYWAAWPATLCLATISGIEIYRYFNGTPITLQTLFFACLNAFFFLFNVYFLLQPGTHKVLNRRPFRGTLFSPAMALCASTLVVPALALTLFVNYVNHHISDPGLLLTYLLVAVLMIVMAFCGVRLQRWVWVVALLWAAALTAVSLYLLVDQLGHAVEIKGANMKTQALIGSGIGLVIAFIVVYGLFTQDLRGAVFRDREKRGLFSPRTLVGGLALAGFALAIYLLPGELGTVVIADAVFGLAIGAVVGLLPGADVANRLCAYYAGVLLAFASYVARGGLLPYTKGSSAAVVVLMLVVVAVIATVVRSRAWFVLMLLGVATMYGLVEGKFQALPGAYAASAGLALVGSLMGFALGFAVSSLLELELVPYKPGPALSSQSTATSTGTSGQAAGGSQHAKAEAA